MSGMRVTITPVMRMKTPAICPRLYRAFNSTKVMIIVMGI